MNKGHGRIEIRTAQSSALRGAGLQSRGLVNAKQVIRVERVRRIGKSRTCEVASYRTSSDQTHATAFDLMGWIRAHWGIENHVHHVRDVTFDEDHSRVRKGHSAEVMAALRNVAIHLLHGVHAVSTRAATHRFQVHPEEAIELLDSPQPAT